MAVHEELAKLLKAAAASMKSDVQGAIRHLESAYALASKDGSPDDVAVVAEELSRAWSRRRSPARSLHYARIAAKLSPEQKATWTNLAKTCELVATRTKDAKKARRVRALYRGAADGFKRAASLTKDPEDKRWLVELAGDAARQAKG